MAILEVDKKLLMDLQAMVFPLALATRALSYSGSSSLGDAVTWIVDHENQRRGAKERIGVEVFVWNTLSFVLVLEFLRFDLGGERDNLFEKRSQAERRFLCRIEAQFLFIVRISGRIGITAPLSCQLRSLLISSQNSPIVYLLSILVDLSGVGLSLLWRECTG